MNKRIRIKVAKKFCQAKGIPYHHAAPLMQWRGTPWHTWRNRRHLIADLQRYVGWRANPVATRPLVEEWIREGRFK